MVGQNATGNAWSMAQYSTTKTKINNTKKCLKSEKCNAKLKVNSTSSSSPSYYSGNSAVLIKNFNASKRKHCIRSPYIIFVMMIMITNALEIEGNQKESSSNNYYPYSDVLLEMSWNKPLSAENYHVPTAFKTYRYQPQLVLDNQFPATFPYFQSPDEHKLLQNSEFSSLRVLEPFSRLALENLVSTKTFPKKRKTNASVMNPTEPEQSYNHIPQIQRIASMQPPQQQLQRMNRNMVFGGGPSNGDNTYQIRNINDIGWFRFGR